MKNVYLLFIYALVFQASCETNNKKKPKLVKELKSVFVKKDSCLVTCVLVVNLPKSKSMYTNG
jgi:hypothetical protein